MPTQVLEIKFHDTIPVGCLKKSFGVLTHYEPMAADFSTSFRALIKCGLHTTCKPLILIYRLQSLTCLLVWYMVSALTSLSSFNYVLRYLAHVLSPSASYVNNH